MARSTIHVCGRTLGCSPCSENRQTLGARTDRSPGLPLALFTRVRGRSLLRGPYTRPRIIVFGKARRAGSCFVRSEAREPQLLGRGTNVHPAGCRTFEANATRTSLPLLGGESHAH